MPLITKLRFNQLLGRARTETASDEVRNKIVRNDVSCKKGLSIDYEKCTDVLLSIHDFVKWRRNSGVN